MQHYIGIRTPNMGSSGNATLPWFEYSCINRLQDFTFEYDTLYRLLTATGKELSALQMPTHNDFVNNIPCPNPGPDAMQNYTQHYQYDALGNILQMQNQNRWTRDYIYDTATNRLLRHTQQLPDTYSYDTHGNMLTMPHLSNMSWDYLDQLHSASNGTFTSYYNYDAEGNRTRKVVNKGNIREERYYVNGYEIYRKYTNDVLDFERKTINISDDEKVFVRIEQKTGENPVIRYQYDNHLGSACLELNNSGQIISYEEYHPFGTTSYRSGRTETEVSLKRYKYCGKERDEETGLYYYGMRYYAAWICRFVSVDPLQFKYPHYTPYQYAGNKPVTFIDLDGGEEKEPEESSSEKKDIQKNIFILIKDAQTKSISFIDFENNGWHGIAANNLQEAELMLKEYVGNEKVNNIFLFSHGDTINPNSEITIFFTNNIELSYISGEDLKIYYQAIKNKTDLMTIFNEEKRKDINSLVSIVNIVKEGKNFVLGACNVAKNDYFLKYLQLITESKRDVYGFSDIVSQTIKGNVDRTILSYEFNDVSNKDLTTDLHVKRYKLGFTEKENPVILKNLQIRKSGLFGIKNTQ